MSNFISFSYLLFILYLNVAAQDSKLKCPIIRVTEGEIQGTPEDSRDGKSFCAYRGIPYAKPPVGKLRFEPPQPPLSWTDVRDGSKYGAICMQFDNEQKKSVGDEDCLFVNVFAPIPVAGKTVPVIVYIHGGYFMMWSGDVALPEYFMDENVILVSMNYRLGAFGFLNTEDGLIRGNMGLKDQVMALQWVQRNIAAFNGDKSLVTISGFSAGGASVHYHLLSKMSKGLFHKAISESSNAIKVWSLQTKSRESAELLVKRLNCDELLGMLAVASWKDKTGNWTTILNCLKSVEASKIAHIYSDTKSPLKNMLLKLGPSVEVTHRSDSDTFITEHPFSIMYSGRQRRIPWIVGHNSHEGLGATASINHNPELMALVENNWNTLSPTLLRYNPLRTDVTERIREFYIDGNGSPNQSCHTMSCPENEEPEPFKESFINFKMKFAEFTDMMTDRFYSHALHKIALIQTKYSPVYIYYNNYKVEYSFANILAINAAGERSFKKTTNWIRSNISVLEQELHEPVHMGVSHGDLSFLLYKHPQATIEKDHRDYLMSRDIIKLWTQFAYDEEEMKLRDVTWHPTKVRLVPSCLPNVDGKSCLTYDVMQFSNAENETRMTANPILDRIKFWESLEYFPPYLE